MFTICFIKPKIPWFVLITEKKYTYLTLKKFVCKTHSDFGKVKMGEDL